MAEGFRISDGYIQVEARIDRDGIRREGEGAGGPLGDGIRDEAQRRIGGDDGRLIPRRTREGMEDEGRDGGSRFGRGFRSLLGTNLKDSLVNGMTFGLSGLGEMTGQLGKNPYVAGFAGALGVAIGVTAAPFIAANMVAGLGLGAMGGVLAAGIALVSNDPKVKTAASDLKNQLLDMDTTDLEAKVADAQERLNKARKAGNQDAINQAKQDLATAQRELNTAMTFNEKNFSLRDAAKPIIDPLVGALDMFKQRLATDIMPQLAKSFEIVAPYLPGLVDAITQLIVAVLPGFNQFLMQVGGQSMATFIKYLPLIGSAFGKFFEILSKDGPTASVALGDLMKWIAGFIIEVAYIIDWTARAYVAVRQFILSIPATAKAVAGWVADAWGAIKEFFVSLGAEIASWPGKVGAFFSSIGAVLADKGEAIANWFLNLPDRIVGFLMTIPDRIRDALRLTFDAVTFGIGYAFGTITQFFADLPGRIMSALTLLGSLVKSVFSATVQAGLDLIRAGMDAIVFVFTDLPIRAGAVLSNLWSTISGAFHAAVRGAQDAGASLLHGFTNWINGLPGAAGNAANNTKNAIMNVFSNAGSWLYNAGRAILQGIADGIQSMAGWVADLAKRAAHNIINGFKSALGIASPSKVAAEQVGKPVAQGVAKGITDHAPQIRTAVAGTVPDMLPSVGAMTDTKPVTELYATIPVVIHLGDEKITQVVRTVLRRSPEDVASASLAGTRTRNFTYSGRAS